MDEFMSVQTKSNEINKAQLKEHLRNAVPEDVYDKWIEYFEIEEIDDEQIVIGYYGKASLRKFEKKYKKKVWLEICSYIGCVKKLEISKRKNRPLAEPDNIADAYNPMEEFDEDIVLHSNYEEFDYQEFDEEIVGIKIEEAFEEPDKENKITTKDWLMKQAVKLVKLCIVLGIVAGIISATALLGCNHISNRTFNERFYNVGNIKANEKIRIVQITDLHESTYGKDNSELIKRIKALKPDVIIYTGDCIEPNEESIDSTVKLCSALSKVAPSYYVYGNNEVELAYGYVLTQDNIDEKYGFDDDNRKPEKLLEVKDELEDKLEDAGVTVLKNETVTISVGTTTVDICGVLTSNPSAFWSYGGQNFSDFVYYDKTHLKVLAMHEPIALEEYDNDFWGDIVLSGHTHGGLIRVPVLGPLYTHEGGLFPERNDCFVSGRYSIPKGALIVSPGLDNNEIFRINNKPELSIIDVNRF